MAKIFRLPNGVTCVTEERLQAGKVSMQIYIKSGSLNESAEENGLTNLMQEACNGGTTTRSRDQLSEDMESRGAVLETLTGRSATVFRTSALTKHTKDIFSILADVVRYPAFDAEELRKTKMLIEHMLDQQDQSPADCADEKFYEAAFSGQGLANNPLGTKALLASYTPAQVRQKHAEILGHPENIVVSFSGDISAADAEKMVQDYFSDLPAAAAPVKNPLMTFTGGDIRETTHNEQLNLVFGFEAPSAHDSDRAAVRLLNEYLSGGMSAPLFQEVREKRGLVYSVHAAYSPFEKSGFFNIEAGTGKGNARELISVTMELLGKVIKEGVDQEALDLARERTIRKTKEALEGTKTSCGYNAGQVAFYGRTVSLEEQEENLKNVTPDDIRRVCADMLKGGKYALSGVGPQESMPTEQEIREMMQAQLEGVTVPAPRPAKASIRAQFNSAAKKEAVESVEPKMTVLKNGMLVVTVERPGNVSCGAWVGAGSDHETPELNGATHMNEHMMFKGTPKYGSGQIDRIIEAELGGGLNAYTSKDKTAYYFFSLKPDALEKVIDICGEMVFRANLDHEEFNGKNGAKGERDVVIEEIGMYDDRVDSRASDLLMATAYPNQPHGRPILGTVETLRAMTVQQLAAYRDEYYAPNNVVFCAAGPVKHEDFVALVEQKYGQMPARKFTPLPAPVFQGGASFVELKGANLCNVIFATESVSNTDPDNLAYMVLGGILSGGTSSRLHKEVVVRKELAAGVEASVDSYKNGGMFYIQAVMEAQKVKPFIDAVYKEIRALADNLTQDELDKVKIQMEMGLLSSMESNRAVCNSYAVRAQATGKLVTQADVLAQVQKLSVDDIKRVARKVLASQPAMAGAVPAGTDVNLLPRSEELIALRDGKKPQDEAARPVTRKKSL